jgi:hypothetical protein
MIEWAKEYGLYAVDQHAALRRGAEEMAKVLADVTVADEDGSDVRINIPFRAEEGWLWDDMRTIRHDRMEVAAALGRNRIVGEIKSHAKQLNFYSKLHPDRPPIQQSFNFENDLLDAGIPLPSPTPIDQPTRATPARTNGVRLRERCTLPSVSHPSDRASRTVGVRRGRSRR